MILRIHLLDDYPADFITDLTSKISDKIVLTHSKDITQVKECDILVGAFRENSVLQQFQNLKTVIIPWAGLPQITAEHLKQYPHITVHNLHHNATITAEMTFTLMLTVMKRIIPIDRDLRKSDWTRRYNDEPILSLKDKHAVVLGYGSIGSQVADYCKAFNMKVSVVSRNKKKVKNSYTLDQLPKLLPVCNVLLITLPLTPETENLITREYLALLPDDATLVNIARGKVVNEEALYNELISGRLRAGIDVWYQYPMTEAEQKKTAVSRFPFHELDNVVMTPHLAGYSDIVEKLRIEALARLLNQAANGEVMDNKIDLHLGY